MANTKQAPVEFVSYLRETLVPDLRDSGREFTADDFDTAIGIMEDMARCINDLRNIARNPGTFSVKDEREVYRRSMRLSAGLDSRAMDFVG